MINNGTTTEAGAVKTSRKRNHTMTRTELIELMVQYQTEAVKKIPQLQEDSDYVGSCWESEKLGHAKGYAQAISDILKKI